MTSLRDLPIRDDLRSRTPYGAPQHDVPIALNVNENTHPIPEDVATDIITALAAAVMGLNRYPDREFSKLREGLAEYLGHGISADQVWAANGSNEVLHQILLAFGGQGRSVLGFGPTYSMHSIIASGTGTRWVEGSRDDGYTISPETAVNWIGKTRPDVVFFCAPNNPTGTPLQLATIAAAYDATPGIVVVDEAYAEFAPASEPSALSLLEGRERLIVSRTMSKAFAFAGARVGYLAANPAVCQAMRIVRLPYHLSALTQAAAGAALANAPAMLAMVEQIKIQRDRLLVELAALGFSPHPSSANFVLFGGVSDPERTFRELLGQGVLIRDVGIASHLRVTAGTEAETTGFLEALARIAQ